MSDDPELLSILSQALRSSEVRKKARSFHRANALKQSNRREFERRLTERMNATLNSTRAALSDDTLDALRFRHWFLHMRFTALPGDISEWRRLIDLDILNKEELEGG